MKIARPWYRPEHSRGPERREQLADARQPYFPPPLLARRLLELLHGPHYPPPPPRNPRSKP